MPDRITLSRAKGYRRPEDTIQVDRATIFGNPWQIGDPGIWWVPNEDKAGWIVGYQAGFKAYPATAVAAFEAWIRRGSVPLFPPILNLAGQKALARAMTNRRALILSRLPDLRGHPLGCRCAQGTPCHADVLLEIANA